MVLYRSPTSSSMMADASSNEVLPSASLLGSRKMIKRIKSVLTRKHPIKYKSKNSPNEHSNEQTILRQLTLNAQHIEDDSFFSSTPTLGKDWILRGLGPEFQQRQTTHFQEKNPERVVKVADIILSIPVSDMDDVIQAVDSFGSNILHLACYHGMDIHILDYILDNSSLESRITAVKSQDRAGNLPLFIAIESIMRGKIEVRQGLEVIELLYKISPKTISHFNHENCMVSEFVDDHIRHMHTDSEEYQQLRMLHKYLRKLIKHAYLLQKKEWEEGAHGLGMKLPYSTQELTEFQNLSLTITDGLNV